MGRIPEMPRKLIPKKIISFNELPYNIKRCCLPIAKHLNPIQLQIASDIILNNDLFITVPTIDSTMAGIVLGSIYKLFTVELSRPAFILFIVPSNSVPVIDICNQLDKIHASNLRILSTFDKQFTENIMININDLEKQFSTLIIATYDSVDLIFRSGISNTIQKNLQHIAVFNCDKLLIEPFWNHIKDWFRFIATNVRCSFISTSSCTETSKNVQQLLTIPPLPKTYNLYQHKNLKHWVSYFDHNRLETLLECVKGNKYKGVIFCSLSSQMLVHTYLLSIGYKCEIYTQDEKLINDDKWQYIVATNMFDETILEQFTQKPVQINPNLKIIINYDIDLLPEYERKICYLRRATMYPYSADNKKVHIVSLVKKSNCSTKNLIENNYDIVLNEMHSNIRSICIDDEIQFDLTKLKNVEQWIVDLINGYIKQTSNKLKLVQYFPESIMMLCLFFYYDELYGAAIWDDEDEDSENIDAKQENSHIWKYNRFDKITVIENKNISSLKRQRKVVPTLNNVVFNRNLLMHKVPILKPKENKMKMSAHNLWAMEHDFKNWIKTVPYKIKACVFGYILLSDVSCHKIDLCVIGIITKYYYQLKFPIFLNADLQCERNQSIYKK